MPAELQSLLAPLVVLAALGYLAWNTWRRREKPGCGGAGECACPKPPITLRPRKG